MKNTEPFPTEISSDSHHFFFHEGSEKLIIFFAAQNMKPEKYNFFQMGREIEENLLFVNDLTNQWYQNGIQGLGDTFEETIKYIKEWIKHLDIKYIYTLGTSMGGHASILYGINLRANILSFAPEIILKTPYSRSVKKLKKNTEVLCTDLREMMSSYDKYITIISGEEDTLDLYFSSIVKETKTCRVITIQGSDHYIPTYLTRASYTTKIIRTFYETGTPDVSNLFEVGILAEKKSICRKIYKAYLSLESTDYVRAEHILNDVLGTNNQISLALYLRGKAYIKQENYGMAISDLALATVFSPSIAEYIFYYSHALRMSGLHTKSLYILGLLLKKFPNFEKAHYAKGMILFSQGFFTEAQGFFDKAYLLNSNNETFNKMRLKCLQEVENETS